MKNNRYTIKHHGGNTWGVHATIFEDGVWGYTVTFKSKEEAELYVAEKILSGEKGKYKYTNKEYGIK